jgi:Xaa-Pro aminopeptidase
LKDNSVQIFGYDDIFNDLATLASKKVKIAYDENKCSERLYEIIAESSTHKDSIVESLKAVKNQVQMEGMRNSNIRDCAAIMKYFGWLED